MFKEFFVFAAILALAQPFIVKRAARDGTRNTYIAYTPTDGMRGEEIYSTVSITEKLDPLLPVIVIVHGHDGSATTTINPVLRNAILNHSSANVIVVDWSLFANRGYDIAVASVPSVGYGLADFLDNVVAAGFDRTDVHLIGFDLGAHVCGFAAREHIVGRDEIAKITGLNPSGLHWTSAASGRLQQGDARVVEIIHTDSVQNGIGTPIGDIDMFINLGRSQPGCSNHLCSHHRAYEIMAASMSNPNLAGNHCTSITDVNRNTCRGQLLRVGSLDVWKLGQGLYRANTGRDFPY